MQVGLIGLGAMGSAISGNVLGAGFPLTVFNRTPAKAAPLAKQGARVASTPADAAHDVVITMLADDQAVEAVIFGAGGVLAAMKRGAIHVSMSTISVALSERLAEAHRSAGQIFVSAPVFGRPDAAAAAKLFIAAAGPREALARLMPLFDKIGQRVFIIGDEPAKANLVKLSGNFLITSVIEALSEAFALTRKGGVNPDVFLELLLGTLFGAPVYKTYGGLIKDERFEPAGFSARLGHKDVSLALAAARELGVPMPVADLIEARLATLISSGGGELDWSALGKLAAEQAGLSSDKTAG